MSMGLLEQRPSAFVQPKKVAFGQNGGILVNKSKHWFRVKQDEAEKKEKAGGDCETCLWVKVME